MKLSLKNLLQNQIVLYVVLFLSVTSMFSYLMAHNYAAVLFFLVIAFLTNYFSKNMIVILGISLLSTNMLTSMTNVFSQGKLREGLSGEEEVSGEEKVSGEEVDSGATSNSSCSNKKSKSDCKDQGCNWKSGTGNSGKCTPSKASFQNMNPAAYPGAEKGKPNLDKAGTIEAAYDNLENIMGSDSIRSMSVDTEKLADRQKELIDQLKNIAPLITTTTKMISSFNMDGKLQGMIDGLTKNISSINSSPTPTGVEDPTPE